MKNTVLIILSIMLLAGVLSQAANISNLAEETKRRLENNKSSAIEWINSLGSPREVCGIYDQIVRDLYWLEKGAASLVIVGWSGIEFCLHESKKVEQVNINDSEAFKAQAKTISYNVAVNSWPGWGDEGVVIAQNDIELGLEAAKLNLNLAFELKKPDDKISAAYWLISALQLALCHYADGISSIDQSIAYSKKANDGIGSAYAEGFKGIILLASGELASGHEFFENALKKLKDFQNDDANSYASQLEMAQKVFVK